MPGGPHARPRLDRRHRSRVHGHGRRRRHGRVRHEPGAAAARRRDEHVPLLAASPAGTVSDVTIAPIEKSWAATNARRPASRSCRTPARWRSVDDEARRRTAIDVKLAPTAGQTVSAASVAVGRPRARRADGSTIAASTVAPTAAAGLQRLALLRRRRLRRPATSRWRWPPARGATPPGRAASALSETFVVTVPRVEVALPFGTAAALDVGVAQRRPRPTSTASTKPHYIDITFISAARHRPRLRVDLRPDQDVHADHRRRRRSRSTSPSPIEMSADAATGVLVGQVVVRRRRTPTTRRAHRGRPAEAAHRRHHPLPLPLRERQRGLNWATGTVVVDGRRRRLEGRARQRRRSPRRRTSRSSARRRRSRTRSPAPASTSTCSTAATGSTSSFPGTTGRRSTWRRSPTPDAEVALSGAGLGTIALDPSQAPGPDRRRRTRTVRYFLTGIFLPGAVDVAIIAGDATRTRATSRGRPGPGAHDRPAPDQQPHLHRRPVHADGRRRTLSTTARSTIPTPTSPTRRRRALDRGPGDDRRQRAATVQERQLEGRASGASSSPTATRTHDGRRVRRARQRHRRRFAADAWNSATYTNLGVQRAVHRARPDRQPRRPDATSRRPARATSTTAATSTSRFVAARPARRSTSRRSPTSTRSSPDRRRLCRLRARRHAGAAVPARRTATRCSSATGRAAPTRPARHAHVPRRQLRLHRRHAELGDRRDDADRLPRSAASRRRTSATSTSSSRRPPATQLDVASIADARRRARARRRGRRRPRRCSPRRADAARGHLGLPLLPQRRRSPPGDVVELSTLRRRPLPTLDDRRIAQPRRDRDASRSAQLTGELGDPPSARVVGTDVLNGRGFFDVTSPCRPTRPRIDVASVTDLDPEFTVTAAGGRSRSTPRARRCSSARRPPASYTFRYFYTARATTGDGDAELHRRQRCSSSTRAGETRAAVRRRSGVTVSSTATAPSKVDRRPVRRRSRTCDVRATSRPPTSRAPALTFAKLVDDDEHRPASSASRSPAGTSRSATTITSPTPAAGPTATDARVITTTGTATLVAPAPSSTSSSTAIGDDRARPDLDHRHAAEIALSGTGLGTRRARRDHRRAARRCSPTADRPLLPDRRLRAGARHGHVPRRHWQDTAGDRASPADEPSRSSSVLQDSRAARRPTRSSSSTSPAAWSCGWPTSSTSRSSRSAARSALEIGNRTAPTAPRRSASCSTPRGTIKVIKLGNLASARRQVRAREGRRASRTSSSGASPPSRRTSTFLEQYGIYLQGSRAAADQHDRPRRSTETISLEGIPGGAPVRASTPPTAPALPTGTFAPVAARRRAGSRCSRRTPHRPQPRRHATTATARRRDDHARQRPEVQARRASPARST